MFDPKTKYVMSSRENYELASGHDNRPWGEGSAELNEIMETIMAHYKGTLDHFPNGKKTDLRSYSFWKTQDWKHYYFICDMIR